MKQPNQKSLAPPQLSISISGEPCLYTGQVEWYSGSGILMGQTGSTAELTNANSTSNSTNNPQSTKKSDENEPRHRRLRMAEPKHQDKRWYQHEQEAPLMGRCVSKQLFITDADEKRKRVECVFKINLGNGLPLGAMSSRPIKVISKPSKKKQSPRNAELCIHHGGLVSLFNRVRSQTVSTKYLGVSLDNGPLNAFPSHSSQPKISKIPENTCFVARTSSWDAFVVWIVDTNSPPPPPQQQQQQNSSNPDNYTAKDFIGPSMSPLSVPYPPPPAVALRNTTDQPLVVHYNQPIVLQCLRTGLVSPVMVIRKVDRASTVLGGARCPDGSEPGGGERGDEILGDPVSQLHRIALQIIQGTPSPTAGADQQQSHSHSHSRHLHSLTTSNLTEDEFMPRTSRPAAYLACLNDNVGMRQTTQARKRTAFAPQFSSLSASLSSSSTSTSTSSSSNPNSLAYLSALVDSKVGTKRSAACDFADIPDPSSLTIHSHPMAGMDSYWSEDVSDAAIWTIVGTDCADYTFWIPPKHMLEEAGIKTEPTAPLVTNNLSELENSSLSAPSVQQKRPLTMSLCGQHFTRDLQVWFGDIPAPFVEYRGRDHIVCRIPSQEDLVHCVCLEKDEKEYKVPIMLVRGDGVIHKTNAFYRF
ncbi:hypothetical protein J3Q64DRAFT_1668885 [Phycomyces blakesleeanus]|uniref:Recombining binding protein suppressor of hairless n=1 Tax=Phycomyces blakesleeanus TaxID=4837 RepID=A0ABR3BBG3_PHYBL